MAKVALSLDILFVADPTKDGVIAFGNVYIGEPDTDPEVEVNRKTVTIVQEDGTPVDIDPSAQPLNTGGGGILLYQGSPVTVLVDGEYSLKINDKYGSQIYYDPLQNSQATISLSGGKIINGSFEAITADEPDDWVITRTGTGEIQSDITEAGNGLASLRFKSIDALGAGTSESTPFDVDASEGADVGFMLLATGALTRNLVQMTWIDINANDISTVDVIDITTDSPLVWTTYDIRSPVAPDNAVQGRLTVAGMYVAGGAMVGEAWFDGVRINDNSANLGNVITADNTVVLENKTINDGEYTGTQNGFVGDVDGNATTAGTIAGQGALATQDTVGAGDIDANAVGSTEINDGSVRFSNEIAGVSSDYDFTFTTLNPVVLMPAGIYLGVASVPNGANIDGIFYIEFLINGAMEGQEKLFCK